MIEWIGAHAELCWLCLGILLNAACIVCSIARFRRGGGMTPELWLRLARAVCLFEAEAERLPDLSPAEKLEYVLSRLRQMTEELGCAFEEAAWSAQIERDMAASDAQRTDGADRGA